MVSVELVATHVPWSPQDTLWQGSAPQRGPSRLIQSASSKLKYVPAGADASSGLVQSETDIDVGGVGTGARVGLVEGAGVGLSEGGEEGTGPRGLDDGVEEGLNVGALDGCESKVVGLHINI